MAFDLSENELALHHLDNAHKAAKISKLREQLLKDFKLYINIYEKTGNQKKIIDYQKEYSLLKDSLLFLHTLTRYDLETH